MSIQRIALLSVHTSPLAPMGAMKTGGMNVYIRELSQELGKEDYRIDIFTRKSSLAEPDVDHSISPKVRVIYLQAGPIAPLRPEEQYAYLSQFTANLMAFATLQNLRYDVVYSHYWLSGWVAAKLKEAWGISFVQMFHTLGHMKKRIHASEFYQPDRRILTEAQVLNWADRVIAATPAELAQLRWLYRAKRRQLVVIPPGVNLERFNTDLPAAEARKTLDVNPDSHVLLFVGRIEPLKAVDTILEALHVLRERQSTLLKRLHFMIVGGDPASRRDRELQRLQDLSRRLGISQIVSFMGAKEPAHLPVYYSAATAVIVPSDYESFGMVALEAMACGTPVIASQVGGLQFLVRDRETGFHVPAREPISLTEAIIALVSDPAKSASMGASAARAAQDYAWSIIAKRLIEVFETVACQKQPKT